MSTTGTAVTAPVERTASASRHRRLVPKPGTWPYLLLGLVFLALYAAMEISRYLHYTSMSWDTAIFVQEVRDYAEFKAPIVHVKGAGYNILGDHFSPVLAVLAPFYKVFPSPLTLLLAQSVLFASSVTIVSATAARLLTRAKGHAIGVAYGLSWGVQRAVDFDFHEIAFAVPLLAVVLRNVLLRRWYRATFWALPLVLVKEDMGLTVAAIGLLLILSRQWSLGALLIAFGAGMVLLTVGGVIPHFNAHHTYDYWSKLPGGSVSAMPLLSSLKGLLSPMSVKLATLGWLFGITGFLALRSPLVVVALPTLGWRFLSDNHDYWGTAWHYNAVLMPVLFLALVDALRRGEKSRLGWYRSYTQSAAVPLVTGVALALCVAVPGLPIRSVFQPSSYRDTARSAMLDRALAGIPSGAAVESNVTPMAHLASRTDLYWLGGDHSAPDYVALDLSYGWSPAAPTDLPGYAQRLHPGTTYQVVFQEDQFVILRHVS